MRKLLLKAFPLSALVLACNANSDYQCIICQEKRNNECLFSLCCCQARVHYSCLAGFLENDKSECCPDPNCFTRELCIHNPNSPDYQHENCLLIDDSITRKEREKTLLIFENSALANINKNKEEKANRLKHEKQILQEECEGLVKEIQELKRLWQQLLKPQYEK